MTYVRSAAQSSRLTSSGSRSSSSRTQNPGRYGLRGSPPASVRSPTQQPQLTSRAPVDVRQSPGSSLGSGPARWVWPKITNGASTRNRSRTSAIAASPLLRNVSIETSSLTGPSPARFSPETIAGNAARSARRRSPPRARLPWPSARHAATDDALPGPTAGPGVRVQPRVHRVPARPRSPRRWPARLAVRRPSGRPRRSRAARASARSCGGRGSGRGSRRRRRAATRPGSEPDPLGAQRRADALQRLAGERPHLGAAAPSGAGGGSATDRRASARRQQPVVVVAGVSTHRGGRRAAPRRARSAPATAAAQRLAPRPLAQLHARRRAAPAGRRPRTAASSRARTSSASSVPRPPPRCRSETISVRSGRSVNRPTRGTLRRRRAPGGSSSAA